MTGILSQMGRKIINIFIKLWQRDKITFVIIIAELVLLPIAIIMGFQDILTQAKFPNSVYIFMLCIFGLILWNKRFTRLRKKYSAHKASKQMIRKGWSESEKEEVRINQNGRCAKCQKHPPRWEYHHVDGNRTNNRVSNCQGLCPNCHSIKTHEE